MRTGPVTTFRDLVVHVPTMSDWALMRVAARAMGAARERRVGIAGGGDDVDGFLRRRLKWLIWWFGS